MKRLLEVKEYHKQRYAGGSPSIKTLKRWIDSGHLPGCKEGKMYFVYIDQLECQDEIDQMVLRVINGT